METLLLSSMIDAAILSSSANFWKPLSTFFFSFIYCWVLLVQIFHLVVATFGLCLFTKRHFSQNFGHFFIIFLCCWRRRVAWPEKKVFQFLTNRKTFSFTAAIHNPMLVQVSMFAGFCVNMFASFDLFFAPQDRSNFGFERCLIKLLHFLIISSFSDALASKWSNDGGAHQMISVAKVASFFCR